MTVPLEQRVEDALLAGSLRELVEQVRQGPDTLGQGRQVVPRTLQLSGWSTRGKDAQLV